MKVTTQKINKDLKHLGLIPRTKAYNSQIAFAKYLYIFCAGMLFGSIIL